MPGPPKSEPADPDLHAAVDPGATARDDSDPAFDRVPVCPACGEAGFVGCGSQPAPVGVTVGGRRFLQPPYDARRCLNCHLVYKSVTATAADLARYYASVDFRKWEADDLYPTDERVLAAVRRLPRGSRVLDFGCSTGRLLARLGDGYARAGFEINAEAAAVAAAQGIELVAPGDLFGRGGPAEYDAVLLVDVFEHLRTPFDVLRVLADKLPPGGILVIATGDSDSAPIRDDPARSWYLRNVEHVVMLNPDHARYIAAAFGLTIASADRCSHYRYPLRERLRQRVRAGSYRAFRSGPGPVRHVLRRVPVLRNAEAWDGPPGWWSGRDHLVVVFEKGRG